MVEDLPRPDHAISTAEQIGSKNTVQLVSQSWIGDMIMGLIAGGQPGKDQIAQQLNTAEQYNSDQTYRPVVGAGL